MLHRFYQAVLIFTVLSWSGLVPSVGFAVQNKTKASPQVDERTRIESPDDLDENAEVEPPVFESKKLQRMYEDILGRLQEMGLDEGVRKNRSNRDIKKVRDIKRNRDVRRTQASKGNRQDEQSRQREQDRRNKRDQQRERDQRREREQQREQKQPSTRDQQGKQEQTSEGNRTSKDDWFVVGGLVRGEARFNQFQGEEYVAKRIVEFVDENKNRCEWRVYARVRDEASAKNIARDVREDYQRRQTQQVRQQRSSGRSRGSARSGGGC